MRKIQKRESELIKSVSVALRFIRSSRGLGHFPQQAKMRRVYTGALLANLQKMKGRTLFMRNLEKEQRLGRNGIENLCIKPTFNYCTGEEQFTFFKLPNPDNYLRMKRIKQLYKECEAVYIGDSLSKDMMMAKQAGITSIWCDFPRDDIRDLYSKLVAISHWKEEDFQREQQYKNEWKENGYIPDYTIHTFGECREILSQINKR